MKNYLKWTAVCLFLTCAGILSTEAADNAPAGNVQEIKAFMGQSIVIPVESPDTVVIDRKDIVDYAKDLPPDEQRPILTALRYGDASIKVTKGGKDQIFHVSVQDPNQNDQSLLIQQLVGDPNLHVRFAGQSVILEGEVKDDITQQKALRVASAFSKNIINFLTISDPLQINIKVQVLTVDMNKLSAIGMQYRGNRADLDGHPINGMGVGLAFMNFGKGSAPFFNITRLYDEGFPLGQDDLAAMLNLRMNQDVAKLLQAPTLTTINGQPAYFLVGQDVPLQSTTFIGTTGNSTTSATYRAIGISLLITPIVDDYGAMNPSIYQNGSTSSSGGESTPTALNTYTLQSSPDSTTKTANTIDENGLIRLFVRPEVTSVAPVNTNTTVSQDFPTFDRKYMETRVALRHKESLVLGGLIDDQSEKNFEAIPFISQIPILGELFKNRNNTNSRRELIFVLTPEIISANYTPPGSRHYDPQSSEMQDLMSQSGVSYYSVKPTRINASEITPRQIAGSQVVASVTPEQAVRAVVETPAPAANNADNNNAAQPSGNQAPAGSEAPASTDSTQKPEEQKMQ
ncbi:MAG: hypothetical protein LBH01_00595 [Verrucomicrobiales bacterium]|jgi:pilus assembly protein CpaC|nr:hypothetical protein [Verrucomicrobiales bacterium]